MFDRELSPLMIGVAGIALSEAETERLTRIRPASVILFSRNFSSIEQVGKLIRRIKELVPGTLLAIDHEGGRVVRFPEYLPSFPAPRYFGEQRDSGKMYEVARTQARALCDLGFDLNLAPVVDILTPQSHVRMIDRCFSSDPTLIAVLAEAFITGMQAGGIRTCAKHFPGSGTAQLDPHINEPVVTLTRPELQFHLQPFRAAIKAGVDSVMTSHIRYRNIDPDNPATFSRKIITDILRGELGYTGPILSDDLEMGAIAGSIEDACCRARSAGCDLLLVCEKGDLQDRAFRTSSG